jgi:hypothetical protein
MTLPKKARRTLIQGSTTYHWQASGNDEGIWLIVEQAQQPELKVVVLVAYEDGTTTAEGHRQTAIVSPALVKRTIHYALEHGWGSEMHTVLHVSYVQGAFVARTSL